MVDIIFENGGTVDKFIGDGIMVKYNWPLEQPDHALRAVRTAVQMQRTVLEKMPEWEAMGLPNFQIGIGIHSGPAVLGNIGDARKMDQTAIGDTINVASRLESLCKTVGKAAGSSILLSDTSRKLVEKDLPKGGTAEFFMVQAGDAEIRGLSQPLRVYAVL
jgi:adenylate cyclase